MSIVGKMHAQIVYNRRVEVLASHLATFLPPDANVLDVGCGDGMIDSLIMKRRGDVSISVLDVLVRDNTYIPVTAFDGNLIPFDTGSFDAVIFVDVLHHTLSPANVLKEAKRVSRDVIVIKDHTKKGVLAGLTLRFMDWFGNAHHGVVLPYNYWTERQWHDTFTALNLTVHGWDTQLFLYPLPMNLFFERSLHFIAKLSQNSVSNYR
jgi:SAM-dependent methyltransferase